MKDFILKRAASLILPFIFVYGIYVILHGAVSPGGSFAGGIIVGLSFIAFDDLRIEKGRQIAGESAGLDRELRDALVRTDGLVGWCGGPVFSK